jgi:putative ABC transport system permease protein
VIRHLLKLVWNRKRANALLIAEIFISFIVIFAVLTASITFGSNWSRPVGFEWNGVWDVSMEFDIEYGPSGIEQDRKLRPQVERMMAELRQFPEVEAVGGSNTPPYAFSTAEGRWTIKGREVSLVWDDVTDGFAETMKMQVVRGRWFNAEDDAASDQPVVIDSNTAKAIYGDADPIGQKLEDDPRPLRIVGVVSEFRKDGETAGPKNLIFRRVAMNGAYGRLGSHILVRVRPGTTADFEEKLVARLEAVAPDMVFKVRHMDQMREQALRARLGPVVLGGVVALFLVSMVALGLTGVLWQNVTRRTREIGLRRAMGAAGSTVHRQILIEVILLASIAVILGSLIVLQLPVLGAFSVVTPPAFTLGFLGALATIYTLTVLCGLYPSWLASRLQPADALRYE